MSEHEHGLPSVDARGVKRVLWIFYAALAVFIAIDVVWFGPDWLSNLGQDTPHVESAYADPAHADPAHAAPDTEEHWPNAEDSPQDQPQHPVGHTAETRTDQASFGGHKHGHYAFEKVPAFHALYGFAGFVFLVLAARVLRLFVMKDEDYYGDDAPLDAEQHAEDGHA